MLYDFSVPEVVCEAGLMEDSRSPDFWLNSGAKFIIADGKGETIQGPLPADDKWRIYYQKENPTETQNGYYPQNIFRLVTRREWKDFVQELQFRITKVNLAEAPERKCTNGVFFFSRHRDSKNVYYPGLRVDGQAIIKKKIKKNVSDREGTYYTLAEKSSVFSNGMPYHRWTNPNLIPQDRWIGLRSQVRDLSNGKVMIELWLDRDNTGNWEQLLTASDEPGRQEGTDIIHGPAHAGIRTDFFDAQFRNYRIDEV